jgi:hypothetical protein
MRLKNSGRKKPATSESKVFAGGRGARDERLGHAQVGHHDEDGAAEGGDAAEAVGKVNERPANFKLTAAGGDGMLFGEESKKELAAGNEGKIRAKDGGLKIRVSSGRNWI